MNYWTDKNINKLITHSSAPGHYLKNRQKVYMHLILNIFSVMIKDVENSSFLEKTNETFIFALNHNNYLETVIIAAVLIYLRKGLKISFVIDWMFQHIPVAGWLFKQIDPVYVYNKPGKYRFLNKKKCPETRTVYERCLDRLKAGRSIGIYPEGTRNPDPKTLKKGKSGIAHLVMDSGIRVLPVGLCYTNTWCKTRISNFDRVRIRIGNPLEFKDELNRAEEVETSPLLSRDEKNREKRRIQRHIKYRIMQELSALSCKKYPYKQELTLSE